MKAEEVHSMSRKLVAYFSAGKETRFAARELAEILNADLYEIKAAEPFTEADLDWNNPDSRSSQEKNNPSLRPAIAEEKTDLSAYDIIFLGFPVWWDSFPRVIATFVENNDFEGKTVIPFATSMGGGMGISAEEMRELIGENVKVTEGLLLNGPIGRFKLQTWLLTMGITE